MSGPWEQYAAPAEAGPWTQYAKSDKPKPDRTLLQSLGDEALSSLSNIGNAAAGAVRGAGSIGATLLTPIDMAKDAIAGKGLSLQSNRERRQAMDDGLRNLGADADSMAYGAGKIGAEIAGTAGAGGLVAKGATAIPQAARLAPNVIEAIRTAGFSANGAGLGVRSAGGAINGLVTAGLVDPEYATTGAAIGGALPGAAAVVGQGSRMAGRVISGPVRTPETIEAIKAARDAGLVIPPSQANPTLANRLMEGFAGKITTAQNASAKNTNSINALAAKAIGLAPDEKITPEVLAGIRKAAGSAYDDIGQAGTITPGSTYTAALDKLSAQHVVAAQGFPAAKASPVIDLIDSLRTPSFDASAAVAKIKELRSAADDAFRTGNTDIARASKGAAKALEDAVEAHLQKTGATDLLKNFRDARQTIAKTYTVESALNATTGTVDANKFGALIKKGKPLTGELKQAGDFANRFPKAAQTVEKMGSLPQTSPLDWVASGAIGMATQNPLALAGVVARPLARSAALSNFTQNRLANQPTTNRLMELLASPEGQQFLYRAAPAASAR